MGARIFPVDFVDDHDRLEMQVERFFQNEFGTGQRSFGGIDEQENAVHHFQRPFNLAAEIGMARCVDDVNLYFCF